MNVYIAVECHDEGNEIVAVLDSLEAAKPFMERCWRVEEWLLGGVEPLRLLFLRDDKWEEFRK